MAWLAPTHVYSICSRFVLRMNRITTKLSTAPVIASACPAMSPAERRRPVKRRGNRRRRVTNVAVL